MALTDEEKAALIAQGEGTPPDPAPGTNNDDEVTTEEDEQRANSDDGAPAEEEKPEDAGQPADGEAPIDPDTFTKQFPNLKGESWEEYGPELETAYNNSFTEGLRLNKELERVNGELAEARRVIATGQPAGQAPQGGQPATVTPGATDVSQLPEIQMVRSWATQQMTTAFDKFKGQYPQVLDQDNFKKFTDAATAVGNVFISVNGREPTYDELFAAEANYFGWQPSTVDAAKGSRVRDAAAGSRVTSTSPQGQRRTRVTDAQVDAYMRMFPNKSRADVVKELEEVV